MAFPQWCEKTHHMCSICPLKSHNAIQLHLNLHLSVVMQNDHDLKRFSISVYYVGNSELRHNQSHHLRLCIYNSMSHLIIVGTRSFLLAWCVRLCLVFCIRVFERYTVILMTSLPCFRLCSVCVALAVVWVILMIVGVVITSFWMVLIVSTMLLFRVVTAGVLSVTAVKRSLVAPSFPFVWICVRVFVVQEDSSVVDRFTSRLWLLLVTNKTEEHN